MPPGSGRERNRRADTLDLSVVERSAAFDRMIAIARVAATGFFVIGAIVEPGDDARLTVAIGVALVLGSALGLVAQRAWTSRPVFGLASFVFDGTIITLMLANALDDPFDVVYTTSLLVVFEGARWGTRGGVVSGAWMGFTVAIWTGAVRQHAGLRFELEPMLQRFGLLLVLGWGVGTMIDRLLQQRSAIQKVVDSSRDGMLTLSANGRILSGNESAELLLGVTTDELIGARLDDLFVRSEALTAGSADLAESQELEVAARPGRWVETIVTEVAELGYSFIVCRDVTARATQTQRLAHDAHHDELTQLANRRRLMQELSTALDASSGQPVSLLLLDLDDFKRVNDTLGHLVGDELLVALAARIARLVRPSDIAVRLGGDEFAIMMRGTKGPEPARALAERVLAVISQPVQIGAASATVTASLGFALGRPPEATVDRMLHDADVALYAAKAQGKNLAVQYQAGLAEQFLDGQALSEDLSRALTTGSGLRVLYQPVYDLSEPRRLVGVEGLCRWTHPTLGPLAPETFVAAAVKSGRARELDRFVRRRAMAELARIDVDRRIDLHVNLSKATLDDPDIVDSIVEDAGQSDFALDGLVLEVTEDVAVERSSMLIDSLTELRGLGARIALDDFGTGQASLASLRWIPVDILKIDGSFVHGAVDDTFDDVFDGVRDQALVEAVLGLGSAMDLTVIAEGIETESQLGSLQRAGCQFGQGYLLGRPIDIGEVADLLTHRVTDPAGAV